MRGKPLLLAAVGAVSLLSEAPARGAKLASAAVAAVRAAAFWVAVLLPLAYVPLLVGVAGSVEPDALLGLAGLHATALVVGHVHDGVLDGA